ncbi:hypothetical protein CRYUN_Cryun29cG0007400 [Craigia yunnanensis]
MEGDIDAEMIFSEGREVEVTSVEEGFKGAWYTATILKYPKNKTEGRKVPVQYKNLLEDDNQKPLTEHVKLSFIRPLPPQPKLAGDQCFELNDVVDAFHLDGWWTGSVSEVLDNTKKYIVSFADPPEEIEFSSSDLRPHWEWVDGKWVKYSKFQEVLVSSDCQELVELSCNSAKDARATVQLESSDAVESSSKKHELCCVSSRKTEGLSTASKGPARSKHVKWARQEGDATPLHPSKKFKDGSSANSLLPDSHLKDTEQPEVEGGGEENVGLLKTCGRMLKLHAEGPRYPAADKMDNLNVADIEVSEVEQMTKEVEPSVPKRLPIECMSSSVTEESCHVTKEEINLQKEHGRNRYQKEGGPKTGIHRREQPHVAHEIKQPKLVFRISQSPSAGKNDAAGVLEKMASEEYKTMEIESSAIARLERAGSQTMSIERTLVVSATDCQKKIIKVAGKSDGILHENEQSPLICHKELQSGLKKIHSVVMEENYSDVPPGFENQWRDPREKSLEIMVQSPLVGMTCDYESEEGQDLPFVKSLPIWKAVELMESFQVMPQNPHFHPLVKLNEILREGVAVGHMLTFASLVQRTSKLTVADPRNLFTSILDALLDMETLGFDVKAVRDRTSDLLFMKDRHEHLQDHSKEVELQATQLSGELSKINEEIDANIKLVRELEEKQALLLSMQESKISQIASLQVSADVTTQDIHSVEYDFESIAAKPW